MKEGMFDRLILNDSIGRILTKLQVLLQTASCLPRKHKVSIEQVAIWIADFLNEDWRDHSKFNNAKQQKPDNYSLFFAFILFSVYLKHFLSLLHFYCLLIYIVIQPNQISLSTSKYKPLVSRRKN